MAVTATPVFTQTPRFSQVQLANANNPNRDGSTGVYSGALSVGANGSLIDYVQFQAITTTASGLLRLFYSPDSGTTWRMIVEIPTSAVTVSGTVGGDNHTYIPPGGIPLAVPVNSQFKFTFSNNTETWNMFLAGSDY